MSYVAPHADFRAAILAAAESGDLKNALERWRLQNLAVVFVRDNKWTARRAFGITFEQHRRFMGVLKELGLTHPTKFRRSEARELYTFTAGIGYDIIEFDLLGGTGDGAVRRAFSDAGLVID